MELNWTSVAVVLSTILAAAYWYSKQRHSYWSSRGVPGPKPWFLFGNFLEVLFTETDKLELKWSKNHKKFYGNYMMFEPGLTICDPEMIKQVMVKDFDKFVNRRKPIIHNEIWDLNLLELEGEKWKAVRSITSPSFTSGKLRGMQPLINRTVDKLMSYLDKVSTASDKVVNIKEVSGGFAIDTIALTSFAIETDTNGDRSTKSPFLEHAKKVFEINLPKIFLILLTSNFLLRLLNVTSFFHQTAFNFFVQLSRQILRERSMELSQKSKRNDLVQLLLDASIDEKELANTSYDKLAATADNDTEDNSELKSNLPTNSTKRKLTENEFVAQCIIFMLAGYETASSTLSYLLYELAINQDVQDRLCDEVRQALDGIKDINTKEYFDTVINDIPLLEATIKETLRKYPPFVRLERRVGVDGYKLGGVELYKNQVVEVSAYSIHHSEEFYPNPSRFDPDRFMPENRHLLVPYTYLPFGTGPRNCVGLRFAYQEIKLVLAQLITRYRFEPTADTPIPLTLSIRQLVIVFKIFLQVTVHKCQSQNCCSQIPVTNWYELLFPNCCP